MRAYCDARGLAMNQCGKLVVVRANVTDDVQVRNVEFWVDGIRRVTDGRTP